MASDGEITPPTNHARQTPESPKRSRSGRAILPNIVENPAVSPSGRPSSDDCYTSLLHNLAPETALTIRDGSGKRGGGCYTNDLHSLPTHLVRRGRRIYYRRRVPEGLREIVGKREVWRS